MNILQTLRRGVTVGVILAVCSSVSASAISSGGIGGRPANPDPNNPRTQSIFIMTLKDGQSKKDAVSVINNSSQQQTITLTAVDGELTNTGAYTCRQDNDARTDVGRWTKLSTSTVTLASGKSVDVSFTVTVPAHADVGEHNGCIVFENANQNSTQATGNVHIRTRQAIRLVVTVPGQLRRDVTIQDFSAMPKGDNIDYGLTLKNSGNVSADVDAKITLKSLFGSQIYSNGGGYPVLANQKLELNYEQTSRPFFGGWYVVNASVQYDKRAGVFGTSSPNTLLTKTVPSKTIFVAPSAGGLLVILLILLAIIGLISWFVTQRIRQAEIINNGHKHTVKNGETVQSIAANYNINWKRLVAVNRIKAPYVLQSGTVLHVPKKRSKKGN